MKNSPFVLALTALLFLGGCIPDELPSFDNFRDFNLNGEWAMPIANVYLTLEDIVTDVPLLQAPSEQPISLFFNQKDAFSLAISDFIEIEDQEILNNNFPLGPTFFSFSTDLVSSLGIELYQLNLSSGYLNWEAATNIADTLVFEIQFLNAQRNGNPVIWQISTADGKRNGQIILEDLLFDMTTGPQPHSNLAIRLDHVNAAAAFLGENFNIKLSIENFTPGYVEGFFGSRQISLPESAFQVDYGGLSRIVDGVFFTDPELRVFISNEVGLPVEITTDIVGANAAGRSTTLGLPPLQLSAPTSFGDSAQTLYTINANNSQVVDFLKILPNEFTFSGNVALNPPFAPNQTNFVGFQSRLKGDLELELPLTFGAESIVFEQDIIGVDLNIDESEYVEQIDLRFITFNSLPLGVNLEMIWYDENDAAVDSVLLPLLKAPNVDSNGRSIGQERDEVLISFTGQRVESFSKTKKISLRGFFETSNGGGVVSLFPDNSLEIRLGTRLKLANTKL